jgi:hypothetical protein
MAQQGSYWRAIAYPIVKKVLEDAEGPDEKATRRLLLSAYPFNYRRGWPYQVWLSEIRKQRGGQQRSRKSGKVADDVEVMEANGQLRLF